MGELFFKSFEGHERQGSHDTDLEGFSKEQLQAEVERLLILIPIHNQSSNPEEAHELSERHEKARELLTEL